MAKRLAVFCWVGLLVACESPMKPSADDPLPGMYELETLNGHPPPVLALSTPEGAIRILSATLVVFDVESVRYVEVNEQGSRRPDGSITWGTPQTVIVPGTYAWENGMLILFLQVADDAILPQPAEWTPPRVRFTVPEAPGIPARHFVFRRTGPPPGERTSVHD